MQQQQANAIKYKESIAEARKHAKTIKNKEMQATVAKTNKM